mmetsp:Transcript_9823/g.29378  ORF Transcript_9823/g.29378 Transcript_9823/m.29378 type:complete len:92 (-) Transcript_9823:56-331(-)|eukprot:CAMPEP_0119272650 /NCGR_PEP_ID=MMETSP1329-20130426/8855_1 /TAXON_ID=114041 /ORGANISM="Genus nov. species nov., Strain RCC1024" /LENGTH=91 /DNA_ID=CAMNT_0007272729 /DNA_START=175 /DNA_END=450 /DNA_ORIENTATION=-
MTAKTALASALMLMFALAQPRRGPPRGPIKEDKSTFFGKEGDQGQRKEASAETQMILTGCALILVFYACFKLLSEAALFGAKAETKRRKQK